MQTMEQAREAREAMYRAVDRVLDERRTRTGQYRYQGRSQPPLADELLDALGQEGFVVVKADDGG